MARGRTNVGGGYQTGSLIPAYELQRIEENKVLDENLVWSYTATDNVDVICANRYNISDDSLYMLSGTNLIKLDKDKNEVFKISPVTKLLGLDIKIVNDHIYTLWNDNKLCKHDLNGNLLWEKTVITDTYSRLSVTPKEKIFINQYRSVHVFDRDGNKVKTVARRSRGEIILGRDITDLNEVEIVTGGDDGLSGYRGNTTGADDHEWNFTGTFYKSHAIEYNPYDRDTFYINYVYSAKYIRRYDFNNGIHNKQIIMSTYTYSKGNGLAMDIYGDKLYVNSNMVVNADSTLGTTRKMSKSGYLGVTVDNQGHYYLIKQDPTYSRRIIEKYNNKDFVNISYRVL